MSNNITTTTTNNNTNNNILWCCITRNDTILVEAGSDPYGGIVAQTAKELLCRAPTPGYEFHSIRQPILQQLPKLHFSTFHNNNNNNDNEPPKPPAVKGVKFHVFDRLDENDFEYNYMADENPNDLSNFRIWTFGAVYDPAKINIKDVQAFLEKMVELTIIFRESSEEWKTCPVLGIHNEFAPILQQRMSEVIPRDPKVLKIEEQLQLSKDIMNHNIDLLLQRGKKLDELVDDATRLQEMSNIFQKRAVQVKRYQMYQNAKHGMLLGTAVTVGVGIIVIPPLVAIL